RAARAGGRRTSAASTRPPGIARSVGRDLAGVGRDLAETGRDLVGTGRGSPGAGYGSAGTGCLWARPARRSLRAGRTHCGSPETSSTSSHHVLACVRAIAVPLVAALAECSDGRGRQPALEPSKLTRV